MKKQHKIFIALVLGALSLPGASILAYVAASGNYRVEFDSINFGGGLGNSALYRTESTFGDVASGESNSASYYLHAGYQQMASSSITLSAPPDVALASLSNIYAASTSGDIAWHVMTENLAGYSLSVKASTDPALTSGADGFSDYVPSGAVPDYSWSLGANAERFGYTVGGTDTVTRFLDNGTSCNQSGGSATADTCWGGFSTSNVAVASNSNGNYPLGATTTVTVKVGISANVQPLGSYSATIIGTAMAL